MSTKISQSLMKALTDYNNVVNPNVDVSASSYQQCGLYFKAKYVDKIDMKEEPSAAMKEGIYFEYLCTGALPRDGKTPEPEKTLKGQLTTAYARAEEASKLFKKIISHYQIKILKTGYSLSTENMTGIIDIWGEWNGTPCIIDLKYSGLIDDKWNELGWNTDSLMHKHSLMIQGVHYKILAKDALNLDVPFYYFVFNSKDATDMKILEEVVDPEKFETHREAVKDAQNLLGYFSRNGFKAFPDYRYCKDCPLFATCDQRHEYPQITKVYY
jgi:hypothetical protein